MRFPAACLASLVFITACTGPDSGATPTATQSATSTVTSVDPSGLIAPCLVEPAGFVDSGAVIIGDGIGDATTLETIGWETHPGCDRVEFGFLTTSGAPASAIGTSVATLTPEASVIRIQYPETVVATGPNDVAINTRLVSAAYVVWTREGRLATDLHLSGEQSVAFSASTSSSPARSIVDIRPIENGDTIPAPPAVTDSLVVLTPKNGPASYPIRVTGYAKTRGGEVIIRYSSAGEVVEERQTVAAGDGSSWGEFSIVIDDGPVGTTEIFVGTVVADVERGVTINLEVT
jgi:hypothetical protein